MEFLPTLSYGWAQSWAGNVRRIGHTSLQTLYQRNPKDEPGKVNGKAETHSHAMPLKLMSQCV